MVRVYYTLYGQLLDLELLRRSFKKVKAAKGGPGIDGQTIEEFEANLEINLTTLLQQLRDKSYLPLPVKESEIPKLSGGMRKLGIPAVRDRVVQQALKSVLEPIFEPDFHPSSYAYRPGRSQHHAIAKALLFIREHGMESVVDMDIAKCFDSLVHDLIIRCFRERVRDGSILDLIRKFLASGIMKGEDWRATTEGSPQGAVFSPLIANVYLNTFDQVMKERGHRIVRFADDIRIFKYSKGAAENALKQSKKILERELRLKVSTEKTKIVHAREGVDFLGVKIFPTHTSIHEKRLTRFKQKVKAKTKRNSAGNLQQVIDDLNPSIRGFANYFRIANCSGKLTKLMSWIRRRLRAKQLKLWKTKKKLRRRLRQRGHKAPDTCCRMGAWVSSSTCLAHQAMPNSFFHREKNLFDMAAVQTGFPVTLPEGIRVDMSRVRGP